MSIRKKILLFSSLFVSIFIIVVISTVEFNIWKSFSNLENLSVSKAMDRSIVGLDSAIDGINTSSKDWAEWTDTYNYILGDFPDFIKINISENQFASLGVNYMIFLDNSNKVVYFRYFDLKNNKFLPPPDQFIPEILSSSFFSKSEITSGIFCTESFKPTILAVRPILKTDGSGPVAGKLIFGRIIDDEIIKKVSNITSFDFGLFRASDLNNPIFSKAAIDFLSNNSGIYMDKSNSAVIYAYQLFPGDLDTDNDLVIKISVLRDVYKEGVVVSWSLVVSLILAAIFNIIAFIYLLNILVVKKITLLVKKISEVETGRANVNDLYLPGKDEVSFLSEKLKNALNDVIKSREGVNLRNEELEKSQKAILNVLEDVEFEKNKSENLIKELQKFKLAVENASDHIVITDANGIVLFANKGVENITGYKIDEVVGKKTSLWGKQMPKEFYENLWKIIKENKQNFTGEIKNRRKNGEIYIAEANISPILNSRGEVAFFVGIERDITKIKEINDAKTEFVSVASHQLRTPLTGIKWLTEILLKNREHNLTEKQINTLNDINISNDRVINLVNDLLSVSRIEGGRLQELNLKAVNMSNLIGDLLKELKSVAENKGAALSSVVALPKEFTLNIDEEKIRQSMNNLISNAIKYSKPSGGKVDVLAEVRNNEFIFSVKDNGIGIALKDQRRIFEKFYRADNARLSQTEGTGLGLFIVKSYIESHGGRIWFESKEGEGSNFSFALKIN